MAEKSTIFKASLHVADMNRHYYHSHALTLARHPAETDERLMVRLLAFALHAAGDLQFGQGMTNDDEADLWQLDLTGRVQLWVDVGTPDERLVRKAANRCDAMVIYAYGGRVAERWFSQHQSDFARHSHLQIFALDYAATRELARLATRNMDLQCLIQDDQVSLSDAEHSIDVNPTRWQ
jgi:uncharacterized protein YaeQ